MSERETRLRALDTLRTRYAITLTLVAVSIVIHGISVTPLMNLYARRKARPRVR